MKLEIKDISYSVGSLSILRPISFELNSGSLVGIIGPNGAGKTTLLKLIAGLLEPSSGETWIGGQSTQELSPQKRAQLLAAVHAGEQRPAFSMSVEDYVGLGRIPYQDWLGSQSDEDHRLIQEVIDSHHLQPLAKKSVDTLSSGEFQKVQLARVLVQNPSFLLLDEPTSHLDIQAQVHLMNRLEAIATQNMGVLLILHDLNLAALFCHELILLSEGQCVVQGKPEEVLQESYLKSVYGNAIATHYHPDSGQLMIVPDRG